jgi:hypothetical protein
VGGLEVDGEEGVRLGARIPALLRELADAADLAGHGVDVPMVYFIQCGTGGPVKIGLGSNPQARRVELQVGNPGDLVVLFEVPGSRSIEANLHRAFADLRLRGEWFRFERPLTGFLELLKALHRGEGSAARLAKKFQSRVLA